MIILEKGEVFAGRFRLEEKIGQGGMGQVWRATQIGLNRQVAVKIILPHVYGDDRFREMFLLEAQVSGSLSHPNIVPVVDFGEHAGGLLWLVQMFVKGQDLGSVLNKSPGGLPVPLASYVVTQVLLGLQCAHEHSVLHRDLKPGNVLISNTGDVQITDFGIAKILSANTPSISTVLKGSPGYLAPELLKGLAPTFAADLFSIGGLLWETLTGKNPFVKSAHADREQIFYSTINDAVPSLASVGIRAPSGMDAVIQKLLAKDARKRYQTVAEALDDLLAVSAPLSRDATPVGLRRHLSTTREIPAVPVEVRPQPSAPVVTKAMPGQSIGVSAMAGQALPDPVPVKKPARRRNSKRALAYASTIVAGIGVIVTIAVTRRPSTAPSGPVAAMAPAAAPAVPMTADAAPPSPSPRRGQLAITVEPADSDLFLDGKRLMPPYTANDLELGTRVVLRGQHVGFETKEQTAVVGPDTRIALTLSPSAPATPDAGTPAAEQAVKPEPATPSPPARKKEQKKEPRKQRAPGEPDNGDKDKVLPI